MSAVKSGGTKTITWSETFWKTKYFPCCSRPLCQWTNISVRNSYAWFSMYCS